MVFMISDRTIYRALANLHGRKVKEITTRFKIQRDKGSINVFDDFRVFVVGTKKEIDSINTDRIVFVKAFQITKEYFIARIM